MVSLNPLLIHLQVVTHKSSADRSQPIDYCRNNGHINAQCNSSLLLLGAMWSPPQASSQFIDGRVPKADTPSCDTSQMTRSCFNSRRAHKPYKGLSCSLVAPPPVLYRPLLGLLLMTVGCRSVRSVTGKRHSMDVVSFFFSFFFLSLFSFVQLPSKWPTPSAFTQCIFSVLKRGRKKWESPSIVPPYFLVNNVLWYLRRLQKPCCLAADLLLITTIS